MELRMLELKILEVMQFLVVVWPKARLLNLSGYVGLVDSWLRGLFCTLCSHMPGLYREMPAALLQW